MSTIRDVAKLANVSVATVSRVLNNDQTYKMKDETRRRVWQAVAQAEYRLPSTPKKQRKPPLTKAASVGCILSVTKDKYQDPYFMSILSGVEQALDDRGYSLAFISTCFELQDQNILYQTFSKPPNGIIIMETLSDHLYSYVRQHVAHCVGVDTQHPDIDNVGYDHFTAAFQATDHLIQLGHKRIAFVGGSGLARSIKSSRRYWGYRYAMERSDLTVDPELVRDCLWDEMVCVKQVKYLMELPPQQQPTAIFAASDIQAIAVLSALYSLGRKVPDQVAVMGLSDIELSQFSCPPLSTLRIPTREIGISAVEALDRRLHGSKLPPQQIFLPSTLIRRSST